MKLSLEKMVKVSILAALAFILMLIDFPLFFAPTFYKLDFSEIPVLVGTFALGPLAGVTIEALKILCNLLIEGTDTFCVGEIANFLIGVSFILPAGLFYKHHKTKKNAVLGCLLGTFSMMIIGSFLNALILLPFYSTLYGIPLNGLINMGTKINGGITNMFTFILFAVVPFNLFKGIITSAVVILIYKRISFLLKEKNNNTCEEIVENDDTER